MTRNKDILSEKEMFEKTSHMIEHAVNARIKLQYKKGSNCCAFDGYEDGDDVKIFRINIANPPDKYIPQYTALLHELAHILYESPFTPIRKLLKRWGREYRQYYFDIWNVLEDQRIESHLTKNYLAYKKRFEKTKLSLGRQMELDQKTINDPINVLLAIRFLRDDLASPAKHYAVYKQALENVAGTDKFGALRVLISIKKFIDEFKTRKSASNSPFGKENTVTSSNVSNVVGKTSEKDFVQEMHNEEYKINDIQIWNVSKGEYENRISEDTAIPTELGKTSYTDDEIGKLLQKGKDEGEKQFQKVQHNLSHGNTPNNLPENVQLIKREKQEFTINQNIVRDLKRVFRLLKMQQKQIIRDSGDEMDVEEYIKNKIKGTNLNRVFLNGMKDNGVSVVLSIDASYSMRGKPIEIAREMTATLFETVKGIPKVEIQGNVWAGRNANVGITKINTLSDVQMVSIAPGWLTTPTHVALEYSARMLKNMKGAKKLLIMITDGMPNSYYENGQRMSHESNTKLCKKSLRVALGTTSNVIFIVVDKYRDGGALNRMRNLFGAKRIVHAQNMHDATKHTLKHLKHFLIKNSRSLF